MQKFLTISAVGELVEPSLCKKHPLRDTHAPALVVEHVSKQFKAVHAVQAVDFQVAQGECIALAGHNGAGKSTLIKMMLGLIRPDHGAIRIHGQSPTQYAVRRKIGYLPETVSLYPSLNALETLNFFAKLKKVPTQGNAALLAQVGIADAAKRRVSTYSKGMRQRLALAQALLGEPDMLFFDEPTTGLDPASRQQFYELVNALRARGASIVLSTHALAELVGQVDRIIIMKQGRKMADGTLYELRTQADLPTVLLAFTDAPLPAPWQPNGAGQWRCDVAQAEKSATLAALYAQCTPRDVEIVPPSLDDVYAAFLRREPAEVAA